MARRRTTTDVGPLVVGYLRVSTQEQGDSGLGLAALPDFMANEHSELVRLLPELTGPPVEAYFVYPEELRNSKRIAVFRDFLIRKVSEAQLASNLAGLDDYSLQRSGLMARASANLVPTLQTASFASAAISPNDMLFLRGCRVDDSPYGFGPRPGR